MVLECSLRCASLLIVLLSAAVVTLGSVERGGVSLPSPPKQCGNTTTYCPATATCCTHEYSPSGFGCELSSFPSTCCKPGPKLSPSNQSKNCLVIGDSVSIGYTYFTTKALSEECIVQHGPYDVQDGGAEDTAYGVTCLDNWLVTQAQQPVSWDVITFNFGLHNLNQSEEEEAKYRSQLSNITARLSEIRSKHNTRLLYVTTTPFMPDDHFGHLITNDLNAIARDVVHGHVDEVVDLHRVVTDHCGQNYTDCDWCRVHPCYLHYNEDGEAAQGKFVAEAIRRHL